MSASAGRIEARDKAIGQVREHELWIHEHGPGEAEYVARYGSKDDPAHYGDGGEAIYAADVNALRKAEELAVEAIIRTPL